ncbi:hypothetical protein H072_3553 [Dactylellina haptotyla CBS 200.50]|uniref:BZIP domain-containing protein n=1 Tax=Dactylellina haptotyla (strain CBS 200.50) TaxID=1284197 RepID=S8AMV2_DACHA|nr:hypothetical protein H072_3553 [Dactylellina haptotyla CBS 200.50]
MATVAKHPATVGANLTVDALPLPSSQLTPNFFSSIFNDGMNPFDECFGSPAPGGISALANSTLRKELQQLASEKPRLIKDEALPNINTRLDQTLTPEQSPKSLTHANAALPSQLRLSRSPSPFTFSVGNTFPDSPASLTTPITSPEELSSDSIMTKETAKSISFVEPVFPNTRKSFSTPNSTKIALHKRNMSLPQSWNSTFEEFPDIPDIVDQRPETARTRRQTLPQGMDYQVKSSTRAKSRFSDTPVPHLISRMDGIFVTENIPSEIKAESLSPAVANFQSVNSTSTAGRKRKKSAMSEDDDDDELDGKLNETEKRARFLERNRIAASKCRKKKKVMNQRLEEKSRLLVQQNRFLSATLAKLRSDVLRLKQMVLAHHGCGNAPIEQYLQQESEKYLNADKDEAAKRIKAEDTKLANAAKAAGLSGIRPEDIKTPGWLSEFHSFQEVESEALKRSSHILDFDDDDFQKLLLGDQLTMLDEDFAASPPVYE